MKNIVLVFICAFIAILFNACLAKNVEKTKYYELGLDFKTMNCDKISNSKISQKISVKLLAVNANESLQSNDILIKSNSLELYSLDTTKFITDPAQMLENTLIKALSSDCNINFTQNSAQISLLIKLLDFYANNENAKITAILWLNEKAILLSQNAPIKFSSNDEIIKAMDIAMQNLVKEILMLIKNNDL